jgi:uncharacterized protein (DUF433 family)
MANSTFDRITVEPGKCGGKPCVRGMRITVRRVLELLAAQSDWNEILQEYPYLEEEDLRQVLRYAAASVDEREEGILIRPAAVVPVESYSAARKAEFLLSNAVSGADYRKARKVVEQLRARS